MGHALCRARPPTGSEEKARAEREVKRYEGFLEVAGGS